jgi:hypothetical protein
MSNETIQFKSKDRFYYPEMSGLKPHTERKIDIKDRRFHQLITMMTTEDYGFIEIRNVDEEETKNEIVKFKRKITHICIWEDIMIISWKHS